MKFALALLVVLTASVCSAQTCMIQTITLQTEYPNPCHNCGTSAIGVVPDGVTWELLAASGETYMGTAVGLPYLAVFTPDGSVIARSQMPAFAEVGWRYSVTWTRGIIAASMTGVSLDAPMPSVILTPFQSLRLMVRSSAGGWGVDNGLAQVKACAIH